jgi:hypothetical protein
VLPVATAAAVSVPTPVAPPPPPATLDVTREILVSVTPVDATIWRDGRDLGQPPLALHLAEGETATLVLSRKGYKTKTVAVGGGEPKQTFALEAAGPAWKPAAGKPGGGSPPMGNIDDVGDPFTKKH